MLWIRQLDTNNTRGCVSDNLFVNLSFGSYEIGLDVRTENEESQGTIYTRTAVVCNKDYIYERGHCVSLFGDAFYYSHCIQRNIDPIACPIRIGIDRSHPQRKAVSCSHEIAQIYVSTQTKFQCSSGFYFCLRGLPKLGGYIYFVVSLSLAYVPSQII